MKPERYLVIIYLLIYCVLGATKAKGQDYGINVSSSSFRIGSLQYQGFKTTTDRPYNEFKKAWWRYIKSKTYIFNHKTHYELKIPSKKAEEEVILVSMISKSAKNNPILQIALSEHTQLNSDKKKEYQTDMKALLIDFKVAYYTKLLQQEIEVQEKKIKKLSKEIARTSRSKNKNLNPLENRLNSETIKLENFKKQLRLIK